MVRTAVSIAVAAASLAAGCSGANEESLAAAIRRYRSLEPAELAAVPETAGAAGVRSDAVEDQPGWFEMGRLLAQRSEAPAERPATAPGTKPAGREKIVPWRQRRGPAYPGQFWHSFGRDALEFPAMLWDDTKATARNPWSLVGIAAAAAAGIAINTSNTDGHVADHYSKRGSQLNSFWDSVGDVGGHPGVHFGVAGAMYLTALAREDVKHYEVAKTMLSALSLNGLVTLGLKVACNTESPNGDDYGWPSGHTSSSFCFATVIYEEYGPTWGLPLLAFATYVGYERVDARNHDFSDVVSGALLGIAIGHAVAKNHEWRVFGMQVVPYTDSQGSPGLALFKQW